MTTSESKGLLTLGLVLLGIASGYSQSDQSIVGTYVLVPSQESQSFARISSTRTPTGSLTIRAGRFLLKARVGSTQVVKRGHYEVDNGDQVSLVDSIGKVFVFHVQEGTLDGLALHFSKLGSNRPNRWNKTIPDRQPIFSVPDDQVVVLVGDWSVPNVDAHLTFTQDGQFKFRGNGFKSEGNYTVEDRHIELVWTKIDDDAVTPNSVKKELKLLSDGTFYIDKYHYLRD